MASAGFLTVVDRRKVIFVAGLLVSVISIVAWKWNRGSDVLHDDSSITEVHGKANLSTNPAETIRPTGVSDALNVDYVGSMACRDCHPEIWQKYRSHPMANSFSKIAVASPIEDYTQKTGFFPPGNRHYRVEKNAEEVLHHESMVDSDGGTIYDQSVPVSYTLGSGKKGRGYVIDREGLMFKSSISWYSDRNEWGLSPDYLPEGHRRFERRITGGCLTCHCGVPNFIRDQPNRFGSPPFLEESIGCERCHGPGRNHIAARQSTVDITDPIVNPGKLDSQRRDAVCAQCHLHGESRILRSTRTPHDFHPGERLEDNWVILVKSSGTGVTRSGRAASQVEHMVSSTCYIKSDGRLGCISCHDPHSIPAATEKHEYFRQRCLTCHIDRGCSLPGSQRNSAPAFDNCTTCHMPSVPSENVLHRSIADHRIMRLPLDDADEPGKGESVVFQGASASIPESELIRARAFKMIEDATGPPIRPERAEAAIQMLMPLAERYQSDPEFFVQLGNGFQLQNRMKDAERSWLRVLELNPNHESTVEILATIYHNNFQLVPAEKYLKRFLKLNPWHGSFHGRLAGTMMYLGDRDEAIRSAERGLELNPTLFTLHEFLAKAYDKNGDDKRADEHRQVLLKKPIPLSR